MAEISIGSPSFKISPITDPTLLQTICAPFIQTEINNEIFCYSFFVETAVPSVIQNIKDINLSSFENIPKIAKLAVDNFGVDGYTLVAKEILPEIVKEIKISGEKFAPIYAKLFIDTIKGVSSNFRDKLAIEQVKALSASSDVNDRVLAARVIPVVKDSDQILTQFRSLSNDRVEAVRIAIVDILSACKFDKSIVLYVLSNAVHDPSVKVRQHTASVFGKMPSTNLNDYTDLLRDEETGKIALKEFIEITKMNGIAAVTDIFSEVCNKYPEECVSILLDICKMMKQEEDEANVIKMCKSLVRNNTFAFHMYEFAKYFTNKEPFYELLSPARAKDWRLRHSLQHATLQFIPVFGARLIQYAVRYSGDLVAIIRDSVVPIWVELAKISEEAIEKINWLSTKGFKQRLIIAKVITTIGIGDKYYEIAERFAKDPVSNVRFCLASRINDKTLFDKLFSDNKDPDILALKQHSN